LRGGLTMTDHEDDNAAKLREELKSLGVPDTSTETFYTGDVSHPVAIALKVNLLVAAALYRKDWGDGIAKADMAYAEKMLRQIAATLRDVDPALLNSLGDIWDIDDDEALLDVMHDGTSTWAPTTTATESSASSSIMSNNPAERACAASRSGREACNRSWVAHELM
jgi:hypothetical protein